MADFFPLTFFYVSTLRPGDRVAAINPLAHGCFREEAVVPAYAAYPVPTEIPDEPAALPAALPNAQWIVPPLGLHVSPARRKHGWRGVRMRQPIR